MTNQIVAEQQTPVKRTIGEALKSELDALSDLVSPEEVALAYAAIQAAPATVTEPMLCLAMQAARKLANVDHGIAMIRAWSPMQRQDAVDRAVEQLLRECRQLGGKHGCIICEGHGVDMGFSEGDIPCIRCRPAESRLYAEITRRPAR